MSLMTFFLLGCLRHVGDEGARPEDPDAFEVRAESAGVFFIVHPVGWVATIVDHDQPHLPSTSPRSMARTMSLPPDNWK